MCRAGRQDPQQGDGSARNTRVIPHKGRGVLRRRGPAHGPAVGGAARRGRHRWPLGCSQEGQGFPCKVRADQETGRQACRQEHAHTEKAAKPDTRETRCQVQSVQRAQDPALPRVLVQEVCYHVCLGSWRRRGEAVAGRCYRHDIGGKKARIYDRGAGRVHISQNGDERKEAVVARRGSSGC